MGEDYSPGAGESKWILATGSKIDILKSEILWKWQLVAHRNLLVDNKKYFKHNKLAKKEEEEYFERCGSKIQPKVDDQKSLMSTNLVLEVELAEEKLPMTLGKRSSED